MRHREQHSQKNEARWWQLPGILSLPWRGRSGRNYHHREIELNTSLKVLWPTNFLGGLRYQINESYSNWLIVDKCLTFNFWVTFDERSLNYKGFLDRLSTNFFFFLGFEWEKGENSLLKMLPSWQNTTYSWKITTKSEIGYHALWESRMEEYCPLSEPMRSQDL